jgi:gas vesicle protein
MGKTASVIVIAAAAFGAGAVAGLLFAPASGEENRRKLAQQVKSQTASLEKQVKEVEKSLSSLEKQVKASSQEFGSRIKTAASSAMDRLVPDSRVDENWDMENADIASDLPHLPKF